MGIFDEGKNRIERRNFRDRLRKDPGTIPGTRRRFGIRKRLGFDKKIGKPYRDDFTEEDCQETLKDLEQQKNELTKKSAPKKEIQAAEDDIQYFRKISDL